MGPVVVLDGAVLLAFAHVGIAPVGIGGGKVRIELDSPVEVLNGTVVLALVQVGIAPVGR